LWSWTTTGHIFANCYLILVVKMKQKFDKFHKYSTGNRWVTKRNQKGHTLQTIFLLLPANILSFPRNKWFLPGHSHAYLESSPQKPEGFNDNGLTHKFKQPLVLRFILNLNFGVVTSEIKPTSDKQM
jgi:hypothetical protein